MCNLGYGLPSVRLFLKKATLLPNKLAADPDQP